MNRRSFIKSSLATASVAGLTQIPTPASAQGYGGKQRYLELVRYEIKSAEQRAVVDRFLENAAIPALNRAGVKPVGVFQEMPDKNDLGLYVLLQYRDLVQYDGLKESLVADQAFLGAAEEYLGMEKSSPAYERKVSTLMRAFAAYPEVKTPRTGGRIFQLRIYESHSEMKAWLKVEMFNEGEIDIFEKAGMNAVFFGSALIGPRLPNLTYMLAFKDEAEQKAAWKKFGESPEWKRISQMERYKDTVSNITNIMLRPAPYSQI